MDYKKKIKKLRADVRKMRKQQNDIEEEFAEHFNAVDYAEGKIYDLECDIDEKLMEIEDLKEKSKKKKK